jgi:hypothetical protein
LDKIHHNGNIVMMTIRMPDIAGKPDSGVPVIAVAVSPPQIGPGATNVGKSLGLPPHWSIGHYLIRKAGVAIVFADSQKYPLIADLSANFIYARLQDAKADVETGYSAKAIMTWASLAKAWEQGKEADQFPLAAPKGKPPKSRDVFIYFINGAKERAPAAAEALIKLLKK